jgi:dipeptidyl aminopeptidase/acylaminoacyl peptidase
MTRIAGDPVHELEALQSISPVYRYAEIQDPVLLIHGRLDQRASIDHAERLRMLLEWAGKPVESLWLDHEAHGFRLVDSKIQAMERVAAFLDQHLAATDKP